MEGEGSFTKLWFCIVAVLSAVIGCTAPENTILPAGQTIRDGETFVSPNGHFELSFFSPEESMDRYVGIWSKKTSPRQLIFVLNGNAPLKNTSGEVTLTVQGTLLIRYTNGLVVWSSTVKVSERNHAKNTISAGESIRDGETLVSPNQDVEVSFFSPENSTDRYVGIFSRKTSPKQLISVLNMNAPLKNTSGELAITFQGTMVIRYTNGHVVWSTEEVSERKLVARLFGNGEFIMILMTIVALATVCLCLKGAGFY